MKTQLGKKDLKYKQVLILKRKRHKKIKIKKTQEQKNNIKTKYKTSSDEGTIAIVGPKRMEYDRVVSMLELIKDNIEG